MFRATRAARAAAQPRRATRTVLALGTALAATLLPTVAPTSAGAATGAAQITGAAQTITGFGASGAWWPNDLANFSTTAQTQAADLLFTSSGIQLSQYRYNIGGGGTGVSVTARAPQTFLTSSGSYDWTRDPGGQKFLSLAAADGVPDLIGFVNSAPAAWTTNGKSCGGSVNTGQDAAYGSYLATIAAHFAAQGEAFDQISPMNEPDDSFSSCGQEGMSVAPSARAGVIDAVGSALRSAGLSTTVIADESSQTTQLTSEAPTWLADASAPGYVSAIAHHTYNFPSGSQLEQVGALGATNSKPVWATEICCQVSGGGYGQQYDPTITGALTMANSVYDDLAYGNDSAFQWWTALSSELGCDPTTSGSCATTVNSSGWNDGLVYYDPNYASDGNQTLYPTKRFYALGQYSKFVRPGAVRYAVAGSPGGVQTLAFWQNNAWTVVATNTNSSATALTLNAGSGTLTPTASYRTSVTQSLASVAAPSVSGGALTATLPAQSITTYVLASAGQPGTTAPTGQTLTGVQSGRCLDVPGGSTTNGTQWELYDCNGGSNQHLTLTASGAVTVYSGSSLKCLDGYQGGTAPGTVVDLYSCNGGANQTWVFHPDGSLTNAASGLCLDAYGQGTANGTKIDEWTCNGGSNQQWTLG
ncbi:beta-glycosidase [Streptacidiphilus pinicola]|uniref:Beta-glycosidase n=1 Tax=Streptacidiphilus pinicola TaxID=2219663 RepID=A0A2X0JEW9_9ACTN|nr:glycoside hydrolase [Streptacidiphilus pinicola]RAG86128.1 beta-glycosidase [Streptacidiphilus pinicola]